MIVDQIKERLQNDFHPFSLHLSNGRKFDVPHRDFIAFTAKVVVVIDEKSITHTISPLHIVPSKMLREKNKRLSPTRVRF
jgi:hypothetical protein